MHPEMARGGLRLSFFVILCAGFLTAMTEPGTAEFIVSVLALATGAAAAALIAYAVRRAAR